MTTQVGARAATVPSASTMAENRANRSASTASTVVVAVPGPSSRAASSPHSSARIGCHGHSAGAPPSPQHLAVTTLSPARRARSAVSSQNRVFPIPASPETSASRAPPLGRGRADAVDPAQLVGPADEPLRRGHEVRGHRSPPYDRAVSRSAPIDTVPARLCHPMAQPAPRCHAPWTRGHTASMAQRRRHVHHRNPAARPVQARCVRRAVPRRPRHRPTHAHRAGGRQARALPGHGERGVGAARPILPNGPAPTSAT